MNVATVATGGPGYRARCFEGSTLAHELLHYWFRKTEGDLDAAHSHAEWRDLPGLRELLISEAPAVCDDVQPLAAESPAR